MFEYSDSGVLLGSPLNPQDQELEIDRTRQLKGVRSLPISLSAETVWLGFEPMILPFTQNT
jgi:hypothetical protein